jgi:hypothetical protein
VTSYLSTFFINSDFYKSLLYFVINIKNSYTPIEKELSNFYNSNSASTISFDLLKYVAIPFLFLVILSLVFILITHRFIFEKKFILKNELAIKTDDFLTELIFSNYEKEVVKSKINEYKRDVRFNKKWYKVLILNKIIAIKQNINGISPNLLLQIYKNFGFHNYSKKLILSRKWENKLLGIYHYQILEYKIKTGYIRPYVNIHKNKFLNSNALIAMIVLSDDKFKLIANYQRKISNADELKILDIIYQKKTDLPREIHDWLNSDNSTIVTLAIKVIVRYREGLTTAQLSSLLINEDSKVRKETVLAIRNLYIIDANELIIAYYPNEKIRENKIVALRTLGFIGDDGTTSYISSLLSEEKDLELKFEMVSCINSIDPTYFVNNRKSDQIENNIINSMLLHATNPYLN